MVTQTPTPKLKVLAEALLEIRFDPPKDISLIVGSLHDRIKDYPVFQNLEVPDFPPTLPEFSNIVKYRFFSEDRKKLYNLGRGILSVNTLNYSNFKNFIKDIEKVLTVYKDVSDISKIKRIGLRYINKIPTNLASLNDDFKVKIELPETINKNSKGFSFQSINKINNDTLIYRLQTEPLIQKQAIMLDMDYYQELTQEFSIEKIISWATFGHKYLYECFKESLSSRLFKLIT